MAKKIKQFQIGVNVTTSRQPTDTLTPAHSTREGQPCVASEMEKSTKGTGGGGASGVGAPPAPVQQQPSPSPSRTSTAATAIATAKDTGPYPRVVAPTRCLLDDEPSSDEEGDADSGGEEGGGGRSGGGGSSEFVSPRNAPANDLLVHAMARRGMPREIRAVGGARGLEDGGRDAYVRRAARVRSLIGGALKKVAGGLLAPSPKMVGGGAAGDKRSHEEMEAEQGALSGPPNKLQPSPRRRLRRQQQQQHEHAAEMAREKAAEVLVLQRVSDAGPSYRFFLHCAACCVCIDVGSSDHLSLLCLFLPEPNHHRSSRKLRTAMSPCAPPPLPSGRRRHRNPSRHQDPIDVHTLKWRWTHWHQRSPA